ncbi:RCC1 repeat-containing protein-like protein [Paramyrothecium foliicola]|nr:RCC1 repeat-containing protein-like protein [Paramyrothecium foliicola]
MHISDFGRCGRYLKQGTSKWHSDKLELKRPYKRFGWYQSMDALFTIGSNGSGQLGIGHKEDVSVPKPVIFHPDQPSSPVVKVAAGGNHTLLLTQAGKLYWSGDPASGACGLGHSLNVPVFQEVHLAKDGAADIGPVALVAATWEASFVVSKDEQGKNTRLYSFGTGMKGELGSGELMVRTPSATLLKGFLPPDTEIVDLAASMGHAVVVLSNGDVYGWGNGRKGQVGEPGAVIHAPRRIDGLDFKVSRAVCCKESTCLFGDPESGHIRVLGSDKWSVRTSAPANAPTWKDVGASWGNVYILKSDGELLSWGRDDHGQLPPPNLPKLAQIAIGSEHVIALLESGDVIAWGWGEHGNCGPQVEDNDVKGRWNVVVSSQLLPSECRVRCIGAGCATSWFYIGTN